MKLPIFVRAALWLVTGGLMILATPLRAAEGGFAATLSTEQQAAAGLTTLTPEERTALDQLVAGDLASARRENLTDLGENFVARRTEADRKLAGLDRLTPEQLAKLNELVAAAMAARPTPKERPRLKESDIIVKNRPEFHGSVTVAYGWGGGGDMRAGSLWVDYYDPESRIGLGLGISTFEGDGYYGYPGYGYPGYYSSGFYPDYYDSPFYSGRPAYLNTSLRTDARGGSFHGDGGSYRLAPAGGFVGRGSPRH
jgi:hypothetical protein